jgi:hypothetical protein
MHHPTEPVEQTPPRYRAVPAEAVCCVVLGGLSLATFFSGYFGIVPVLAVLVGWWSLRRIARSPADLAGEQLAWTGIGMAVVFGLMGAAWLYFAGKAEAHWGYQAISYEALQLDPRYPPDPNVEGHRVPGSAWALNEKKIYIKGYMMTTPRMTGIKRFFLCPTNGVCNYCPVNPAPTEIIEINFVGDETIDYTTRLIGVGGKFLVDQKGKHQLPYSIEADYWN